jgi:6-phosphogluconate dehydrogenase (decarboxylating)
VQLGMIGLERTGAHMVARLLSAMRFAFGGHVESGGKE